MGGFGLIIYGSEWEKLEGSFNLLKPSGNFTYHQV
jgi:hypothetical protein